MIYTAMNSTTLVQVWTAGKNIFFRCISAFHTCAIVLYTLGRLVKFELLDWVNLEFRHFFLLYCNLVMNCHLWLEEETGVTGENQPLTTSHWQLSHMPLDMIKTQQHELLIVH